MSKITYNLNSEVGVLTFDATVSETHDASADVTDNPVESGSNTTDNVRGKPKTLTLDVLVTDYPLKFSGSGRDAPAQGRSVDIYALLDTLRTNGARMDVATSARDYYGMVITSLQCPRDKAYKGALRIKISLKEIITVASQVAEVKVTVLDRKSVKPKTVGEKSTTKANAQTRNRSFLQKGLTSQTADNALAAVGDGVKKVFAGTALASF